MAKTKISKLAKDLNVSLGTAVEFLRKNGIEIDDNPNTRVEDNIAEMLTNEFDKDRLVKARSEKEANDRARLRDTVKAAAPAKPAEPEEVKLPSETGQKPKILGKIDLDAKGNPIKPAPAPKPEPKEAPKAEVKEQPKAEPKKEEPKEAPKAEVKEEPKAEVKKRRTQRGAQG